MSYAHLISLASRTPWAILPEKLAEIMALLELKLEGGSVAAEVLARYAAEPARQQSQAGAIGVIPLYGVISQRMNLMAAMSGGTSTQMFTQALRALMADPQISAIVIDVDSPGGNVFGIEELASEIRSMRNDKPIVAHANSLMASAAYWISSAASEIVATPGGEVGSIGVLAMHTDESGANAQAGINPTIISAGKYKAEMNSIGPLSEDAHGYIQSEVDRYYRMFLSAVAVGRRVPVDTVRSGFGEGRMLGAQAAMKAGMIDRVETIDETIARLGHPQSRTHLLRQTAASAYIPPSPTEDESQEPTGADDGRPGVTVGHMRARIALAELEALAAR